MNHRRLSCKFLFSFFQATPAARNSQARGQIRTVAEAYSTATAMADPSRVCSLHHSSQQCPIFNPLSGARDQTHILIDTIGFVTCWAITTPHVNFNVKNHVKFSCKLRGKMSPTFPWLHFIQYCIKTVVFFFFFLSFFSFSFLAVPWHAEFLGQGSDPSHSCDLHCSCGNAGSFNPLCQTRN